MAKRVVALVIIVESLGTMENYKDVLAKFANQMNMKIATETATSEQNKLKKEFGRIFQTNHCSLRSVCCLYSESNQC